MSARRLWTVTYGQEQFMGRAPENDVIVARLRTWPRWLEVERVEQLGSDVYIYQRPRLLRMVLSPSFWFLLGMMIRDRLRGGRQ